MWTSTYEIPCGIPHGIPCGIPHGIPCGIPWTQIYIYIYIYIWIHINIHMYRKLRAIIDQSLVINSATLVIEHLWTIQYFSMQICFIDDFMTKYSLLIGYASFIKESLFLKHSLFINHSPFQQLRMYIWIHLYIKTWIRMHTCTNTWIHLYVLKFLLF